MTNPIRRDLQIAALFTGMRTENVTKIRWDSVDWDRGGLFVPRSKTTPFTIPVSTSVTEILQRRREQTQSCSKSTAVIIGWVLPALSDEELVIPIAVTVRSAMSLRRCDSDPPPRRRSRSGSVRRCAVLDPDNSGMIFRACAAHLTAVYAAVEMANDS